MGRKNHKFSENENQCSLNPQIRNPQGVGKEIGKNLPTLVNRKRESCEENNKPIATSQF